MLRRRESSPLFYEGRVVPPRSDADDATECDTDTDTNEGETALRDSEATLLHEDNGDRFEDCPTELATSRISGLNARLTAIQDPVDDRHVDRDEEQDELDAEHLEGPLERAIHQTAEIPSMALSLGVQVLILHRVLLPQPFRAHLEEARCVCLRYEQGRERRAHSENEHDPEDPSEVARMLYDEPRDERAEHWSEEDHRYEDGHGWPSADGVPNVYHDSTGVG